MNRHFLLVLFVLLLSPAAAEAQSARSAACMAKNGFTADQWRARSVPAGPAIAYRKCMSAGGGAMEHEPPPGTLAVGETVYVACGEGKRRKITGGDNAKGIQRSYGECR